MRPVIYSITGVNASNVYAPDNYISPFNISLGVTVTGTVTYSVQYTFDSVFASDFDSATANWVDHPSLTAKSTSLDSNIAYPVQGIRLNVTAGSGTTRLTLIQAGGGV